MAAADVIGACVTQVYAGQPCALWCRSQRKFHLSCNQQSDMGKASGFMLAALLALEPSTCTCRFELDAYMRSTYLCWNMTCTGHDQGHNQQAFLYSMYSLS